MAAEDNGAADTVTIGVCVMEKKVFCSPMEQILERLRAFGEFEIIIFGDKVILEDPIEIWPKCDCLIAFCSSGFPLQKAQAYAALRRPFLVNELEQQYLLHDRRKVYEHLEKYGIPVPSYALVNREFPYQELDHFIEQEDFVEIHGKRFLKPFVEKPANGDDHRIMIYYPNSAGGGMKELFRKMGIVVDRETRRAAAPSSDGRIQGVHEGDEGRGWGTQIRQWWGMRSRGAGLASSNAGPGRVSRPAGTRRSRAKSPAPPSPRVRRRPKRPPASDVTWGQMVDGSEAAQRREGRFRERSGRRRKLMSSRRPARVSGETGLREGG